MLRLFAATAPRRVSSLQGAAATAITTHAPAPAAASSSFAQRHFSNTTAVAADQYDVVVIGK